MLVHGEGDDAGKPFRLRDDQLLIVYRWFEYEADDAGNFVAWRYDELFLECATGFGKTELGAGLALEALSGPTAMTTPNIPIAAASYDQADILFSRARQIVEHENCPLRPFVEPLEREIQLKGGKRGRIYRVAAVAGTNEGTIPTLFMADETHEWLGNKERVHLVIKKSLRKRKGARTINMSTPGHNLDTLAGRMHEAGRLGTDPRLLHIWIGADETLDLDDPDQLRLAIAQANPWKDAAAQEALVGDFAKLPRHEFRRYHLASWVPIPEDSWLADKPGAWEACEGPAKFNNDDPVVMWIDMSLNRDTTSVGAVQARDDGKRVVKAKVFDPANSGGRVDYLDVRQYVRSEAKRLRAREVLYDPRFLEFEAQQLLDDAVPMVEFPQAQPLDEPVLTPLGWRKMGDLEVGDSVTGANGRPTRITAIHDRGVKPVYEVVLSDKSSTRCTLDHLWLTQTPVERYQKRPGKVRTLGALLDLGLTNADGHISLRFVPTPAPVEHPQADLPVDPYVLGVLLGDGNLNAKTPRFTSGDPEIVARVAARLPPGVTVTPQGQSSVHFALSSGAGARRNPLRSALLALGLDCLGDAKFVPDPYFFASAEQRLELLRGLLDADGTVDKGMAAFASTAPRLRDAVVELTRSLGGVARVSEVPISGKMRRRAWVVSLNLPLGCVPFALDRKAILSASRTRPPCHAINSVDYVADAEVRCITVDNADGLYVTKDYLVTHNSPERMSPACGHAYDLIVAGMLEHDGDPILTAHVQAAVKRETDRGWSLSKGKSAGPIDACIGMVMALWALAEPDEGAPNLW